MGVAMFVVVMYVLKHVFSIVSVQKELEQFQQARRRRLVAVRFPCVAHGVRKEMSF